MNKTIAVIGAGGWGITLAKILGERGAAVALWCHGRDTYHELEQTRESRVYLPGVLLPVDVRVTRSLADAVADAALIICALPSHAVRQIMEESAGYAASGATVLCGTKGLEENSLKTMSEVLAEVFGKESKGRHAFISGPSFAAEVARGLPAAVTVAAYSEAVATAVQETLSTHSFRVYTSKDVVGVQMGGVIKNVIAIAAGISDGLGLGQSARAALITRGLAEMTRLAVRMGAEAVTLAGLPGLGDLILTCSGELSRNRQVGLAIARGKTLEEIITSTRTVAEGVRNTRSVCSLASRLGVEMPIVDQMQQVLYGGKNPSDAVRDLLQRALKPENS
jgi:glycerol-3-phosphate dehydrogenase (NAD(P)+)